MLKKCNGCFINDNPQEYHCLAQDEYPDLACECPCTNCLVKIKCNYWKRLMCNTYRKYYDYICKLYANEHGKAEILWKNSK
jgi:hypothetical protein